MNALKLFGLLLTIAFVSSAFTTPPTEAIYKVDLGKSQVFWKGYKVTGSHEGTLTLKNGELTYTDNQLSGGSFDIDMTSLDCTDLKGGGKTKLEGHLKSTDFFNVAEFPTARFEITKVVSRGKTGDYKIIGDLTIKGITKSIKFQAMVNDASDGKTATASTTIDRSEFNIRYGSGSFFDNLGDKTIYDEFDLSINLVLAQ
ncbi:MAG: YceI family protein [Bacteroidota bacterium]